jgi:hypothetical protein
MIELFLYRLAEDVFTTVYAFGCFSKLLYVVLRNEFAGPAAERTGPAAERTGPAAERTGPAAERTGPAAERTGPAGSVLVNLHQRK